jgi:3',5'-cyclic AMP phosphodiesterase CpdA
VIVTSAVADACMRVIAHLSDLHIGKDLPRSGEVLLRDLQRLNPDLTVVTGDLTGRALLRQFRRAEAYLQRLPQPSMVIPGNHDVPVALAHRLIAPLARYKYYISKQLFPVHIDRKFCVLGINTARSIAIDAGGFSGKQIRQADRIIRAFPKDAVKIVLTHHPFVKPPGILRFRFRRLATHCEQVLRSFERSGVDLILSGHFHKPYVVDVRRFYTSLRRPIIHAQAGSAFRKCQRPDEVSYNVIRLTQNTISVEIRKWNGRSFRSSGEQTFKRIRNQWRETAAMSPRIRKGR